MNSFVSYYDLLTKEVPGGQWGFFVCFFNKQESISHLNLKGGKCNRPMPPTNNTDELETFLFYSPQKWEYRIQLPMYSVNSDHPF